MNEQTDDTQLAADAPDIDWSHVRETKRMLSLAAAQLEIAKRDSDGSMQQLIEAFTAMVDYERDIAEGVAALTEQSHDPQNLELIRQRVQQIGMEIQNAIVAFQFYDKLSQRMEHVSSSIESLSSLVGDSQRHYSPASWRQFQAQIRAQCTMREEHEMFDSAMATGDVRSAILRYDESHREQESDDGCEFF